MKLDVTATEMEGPASSLLPAEDTKSVDIDSCFDSEDSEHECEFAEAQQCSGFHWAALLAELEEMGYPTMWARAALDRIKLSDKYALWNKDERLLAALDWLAREEVNDLAEAMRASSAQRLEAACRSAEVAGVDAYDLVEVWDRAKQLRVEEMLLAVKTNNSEEIKAACRHASDIGVHASHVKIKWKELTTDPLSELQKAVVIDQLSKSYAIAEMAGFDPVEVRHAERLVRSHGHHEDIRKGDGKLNGKGTGIFSDLGLEPMMVRTFCRGHSCETIRDGPQLNIVTSASRSRSCMPLLRRSSGFQKEGTPKSQLHPPKTITRLHPLHVRFTHDAISGKFRNGGWLDDAIEGIMQGILQPEAFPPLVVVFDGYTYYSLSNRRLFVFRVLAKLRYMTSMRVRLLNPDDPQICRRKYDKKLGYEASKWERAYSSRNGGKSVLVKSKYHWHQE